MRDHAQLAEDVERHRLARLAYTCHAWGTKMLIWLLHGVLREFQITQPT